MDHSQFNAHTHKHIHLNQTFLWPDWLFWTFGIGHITMEALGLVLQILFLATLVCNRKMTGKPQNLLLVNLAAGDIVWIMFVTPFNAVTYFKGDWPFGEVLCSLSGYFCYGLAYQSLMTHMFIAYDRYKAIVHALQYKGYVTRRKYLLMCMMTWLYSFIIALPPMIGWNRYVFIPYYHGCHIDWDSAEIVDMLYLLCFSGPLLYYSCCVAIMTLYVLIYRAARRVINYREEEYIPSYNNRATSSR